MEGGWVGWREGGREGRMQCIITVACSNTKIQTKHGDCGPTLFENDYRTGCMHKLLGTVYLLLICLLDYN